ncbi:MAG: OmpA family protein [Alphaproteobacteria bacterium]|nr:OmpA family protein [Alphaproteobacteria bacterium]
MINKSTFRAALSVAALTVAFGSTSALAQESSSTRFFQGLYLSGAVGAHQTDDADMGGGSISVENSTDAGLAGLVGLGLQLGATPWRTEIEVGYRDSDVDSISGASGSGGVDALSFMGNVFYDIGVAKDIDLYVGGGLGLADVDYSSVSPVSTTTVNENDLGWAWQLGAGAAYALNDRLKLTLDYRFLNIEDLDFQTSPSVAEVDAKYRDHAIFIGLRFNLTDPAGPMIPPAPPAPAPVAQAPAPQPAPPPPPPPAPEPPKNFIVFFDWDQSVITAEALTILRDAADTAKTTGSARIIATGHADRSGATDYNSALSERRANAVRAQLQTLGINPSTVATFARGESDPLVPTPDGVREPQNRRVELVLQ